MEQVTPRKLAFIGPMGSGKSSLGRRYTAKYGGTVFDTDAVFTSRYGQISDFFARRGEEEFRKIETEIMREAANSTASVISTGGGAVLNRSGMNALRRACDIVYLTAPEAELARRIAKSDRPLKGSLGDILKARAPLYERYADRTIDSSVDSLAELEKALQKPRKRRYDIVLCDADETVLNYKAAMRHSMTAAARAVGIKSADEILFAKYKIVSDDIWGRLERGEITHSELNDLRFKLLRDLLCEDYDIQKMNDVYFDEMKKTRFLLDGAIEFLTNVRRRGIKVYIATNAFESIGRERLKALDGYIDGAFISETIGYDKPDVRYFERVHAAIGKPDKNRMIMFGDGVTSDIAGGIAFGIDTCLFDVSASKISAADFSIGAYPQFFDIL